MDGRAKRVSGPLTRRNKLTMAAVGVVAAGALGGVSIWTVSHPGSYDRSHNGCITVNVASSTGGGILHGCGAQARSMCRSAFASDDQVARLTQEQCRLAGLGAGQVSRP